MEKVGIFKGFFFLTCSFSSPEHQLRKFYTLLCYSFHRGLKYSKVFAFKDGKSTVRACCIPTSKSLNQQFKLIKTMSLFHSLLPFFTHLSALEPIQSPTLHPGSFQPWKKGRGCQAWETSLLPWIDSWHFQRGSWRHRGTQQHLLWPLLQQPLDCPRFGKKSHSGPESDKRFASPSAETRIPVCSPICWSFCTIPLETCCTSVWGCTEIITSRLENVQRPVLSSGLLLHFE